MIDYIHNIPNLCEFVRPCLVLSGARLFNDHLRQAGSPKMSATVDNEARCGAVMSASGALAQGLPRAPRAERPPESSNSSRS